MTTAEKRSRLLRAKNLLVAKQRAIFRKEIFDLSKDRLYADDCSIFLQLEKEKRGFSVYLYVVGTDELQTLRAHLLGE